MVSGFCAVSMPYSMSPSTKARCMISRHQASRTTFHQRCGRLITGHGSHTPAQIDCRHAGMVSCAQSSRTMPSSLPVAWE